MRCYGAPIGPDRRYRNRLGVYAVILDRRGRVLITEDTAEHEFQLPGGGIDPGEGALRALHRECLEETGWRIRVVRRLGAFQRYAYTTDHGMWARKICHVYLGHPVRRHGAPTEPFHRAHWMDRASAIRLVANDGDRAFLARPTAASDRTCILQAPPALSGAIRRRRGLAAVVAR